MAADEFHKAVSMGDMTTVRSMLDADPSLVNKPTSHTQSSYPIHAAVTSESPDALQMAAFLLDHGADVNRPAEYPKGQTALHYAIYRNDLPMAKLLLDRGANPNARNDMGQTPLFGVVHSIYQQVYPYQLKGKSYDQYLDDRDATAKAILALLIERGADVDAKDAVGTTPLKGLPRDFQDEAKGILAKREKRGLAEVSVKKKLPQMVTAKISSYLDPQGKRPAKFLPGSGRMRKTRRRRTLRKHK